VLKPAREAKQAKRDAGAEPEPITHLPLPLKLSPNKDHPLQKETRHVAEPGLVASGNIGDGAPTGRLENSNALQWFPSAEADAPQFGPSWLPA
jgi:hypothetical protein